MALGRHAEPAIGPAEGGTRWLCPPYSRAAPSNHSVVVARPQGRDGMPRVAKSSVDRNRQGRHHRPLRADDLVGKQTAADEIRIKDTVFDVRHDGDAPIAPGKHRLPLLP